jgi:hypothetical protein
MEVPARLTRMVERMTRDVMNSFWARGLNFFHITGIAFALIDFAFMVFYLSMYLALI